jgi:hypothetical protein
VKEMSLSPTHKMLIACAISKLLDTKEKRREVSRIARIYKRGDVEEARTDFMAFCGETIPVGSECYYDGICNDIWKIWIALNLIDQQWSIVAGMWFV